MTDIHIAEGRIPTVTPPITPGHEFAGVVVAIGPDTTEAQIGDRVVVCVDIGCRRCDFCLRGETTRCVSLTRLGFERAGGMSERVNVPAANLEPLAEGIPFETAAIIPDAVVSMPRVRSRGVPGCPGHPERGGHGGPYRGPPSNR